MTAMKLDEVVPLGRTFDEYRLMFVLTDGDTQKRILSAADGPAGFNAVMKKLGGTVTSVDPVYQFSAEDIGRRFYEAIDGVMEQVRATTGDWTWDFHKSPEGLRANRVKALETFLADFEGGKREGRYVVGELSRLDFEDSIFDLALCSHFLFLYSDMFSYEFHRDSVLELLRVAHEVRIFPLLKLSLDRSPYVGPLTEELEAKGFRVEIIRTGYEIQRGGNEMMRVGAGSNFRQFAV